MNAIIDSYTGFINIVNRVTGAIAALALVSAAVIVTEGIIVRKLLGVSAIWQIEASVILLIYATFVGAAHAQMNEKHLNVDLLIDYLDTKTKEIVLLIVSIFSCIICAVLAWYAWPMWLESFLRNDHSESLWAPPLWIPYFFIPLGMSILFLQYIAHILKKISDITHKSASGEGENALIQTSQNE